MCRFVRNLFFIFLITLASISAQWKHTNGPSGKSGAVYTIQVEDSLLYVYASSGIFYSNNNGITWYKINQPVFSTETTTSITSLEVDNKRLFATGYNLYSSSDNGQTWNVEFEPAVLDGGVNVVGAEGDWILTGSRYGPKFMQSSDGGETWEDLADSNLYSIQTIYQEDLFGILIGFDGIFITINGGVDWQRTHSFPEAYVSSISIQGNEIYAAINNYILHSTDRGKNWGSDSLFLPCNVINSILTVNDKQGNHFTLAGTDSGIFKSINGQLWTKYGAGIVPNTIYSLASRQMPGSDELILYAGTTSGIYISVNNGQSWEITGIPSGQWSVLSAGAAIYAGTTGYHYWGKSKSTNTLRYRTPEIYTSTDTGTSWFSADEGINIDSTRLISLSAALDNNNEYQLFANTQSYREVNKGALYKLNSSFNKWEKIFPDSSYYFPGISASGNLIFASAKKTTITDTLKGILRSTDGGTNWEEIDSVTADDVSVKVFAFNVNKIYAAAGEQQVVYVGRQQMILMANGILVSEDNASTWNKLNTDFLTNVMFDPNSLQKASLTTAIYVNGNNMLIGMQPYPVSTLIREPSGGIYHLVYNNERWLLTDSALIGRTVYTIAASASTIFAATDSGLYKTTDFGKSWEDISSGLASLNVTSLAVSGNNLLAATPDGVWIRPLSQITSIEYPGGGTNLPDNFVLYQNYPNPFNPSTSIKYSIPQNSHVVLKVYDVLGREVSVIISEEKQAGEYTVNFNASELSTGVYFYRIKAGEFTATKKFLFMK